jgi:hypothetical protein
MLLSDRDIRAEVDAGRLVLDPWDAELVQPSSVDVRLDRYFRVFNNSQYTHIDPSQQQDELTTLVEPKGDEPFVLHPGEFVLGSTLEIVTLPDDLPGGKVQPRSARSADPLHRRIHRPRLHRPHHARAVQCGEPADHPLARHEDWPVVPVPALQRGGAPLWRGRIRLPLPGSARADPQPIARQLPALADLLSERLGRLSAARPYPGVPAGGRRRGTSRRSAAAPHRNWSWAASRELP